MVKVIGVRFKTAGKVYYFDPGELELEIGANVIVETARGMEFGTVSMEATTVDEDNIVAPLKRIVRVACEEDYRQHQENVKKKEKAMALCQEKIDKHGLVMKLIDVEYTFDKSKIIFYFTADGRVDFRELVKDLASVFKMRIELRQIGVRDEAKMLGGIGSCGRSLCCHSWLADFEPVSIKMAKVQNLSLNPAKISGICGRLMCCLKYENDIYMEPVSYTHLKDVLVIYSEDNGLCKILNHSVEKIGAADYIRFTTTHFSTFAVVDKEEAEALIKAQNEAHVKELMQNGKFKVTTTKTSKKSVKVQVCRLYTSDSGD